MTNYTTLLEARINLLFMQVKIWCASSIICYWVVKDANSYKALMMNFKFNPIDGEYVGKLSDRFDM